MADASAAHNVPVRSVSDDQLLSHSEAFASIARDCSTSGLCCESDDLQNLTKSDDIETRQRPTCNHDVPENCTSSCWTFADYNDAAQQCAVSEHGTGKTESWPTITQQCSMTKSKSSEHCCLRDDAYDQSPVNQSTCFYPPSR